jgi:adenylate kinase family enzyme
MELDTSSQTFDKSFKDLCAAVEPTVLNIISHGEGEDETFASMMETLTSEGYVKVPVNELISLENERRTEFGRVFMQNIATGKVIPSEDIVRFLRKVLYSGDGHKKYILSGDFPTSTDQVKEFEKSCSTISAVIYSGTKREDMISYNIPNNMLRVFETKSLFLKENRLQVVSEWDSQNWQEVFASVKVDWCLVTGSPLSGKTTVTKYLLKHIGSQRAVTVIDHKEHEAAIRASMATPEGPYEGEVPLSKIEDSIASLIQRDKKAGKRVLYVFDSFPGHKTAADFAKFTREKIRCPADFIVSCQINQDGQGTLPQRFKKKLEVEADLSEEQQDQYRNMMNDY